MSPGVLFALSAYALYSCCDAIVKGLGAGLSVYQIAFFTTLLSLLPAIATTPKGESWLSFWRLKHPLLLHMRGLSGVIGNLCIIYAFTTIPLAEVYSIAFLAPIFIVVISIQMLGERVSLPRWVFLAASFVGVLIVVRPGFRELQLGHLLAVVSAICGAITTTILRRIGQAETRASLIGIASAYILVVNGVLMLATGDMRAIDWQSWVGLLTIGGLGGTANILFIAAMRRTAASVVGPIQYSQIFWALVFGALFYKEFPAPVAYLGLALIVVAGVFNVISDETRIRIFSRLSPGGAGPSLMRETTRRGSGAEAVLEGPIAGATEAATEK
jgi:drug/metabolite transporter (DMT)-like permease